MVSALIGAATTSIMAQVSAVPESLARHEGTLAAFVDTLLPDDGVTPSASMLGVDADLREFIVESETFTKMTDMVCDWLDTLGPVPFAELSPEDRLHIADYMAEADRDMLEGRFYHLVRLLAIEFYYARTEALVGLNLAPAPQPSGYPPPWS